MQNNLFYKLMVVSRKIFTVDMDASVSSDKTLTSGQLLNTSEVEAEISTEAERRREVEGTFVVEEVVEFDIDELRNLPLDDDMQRLRWAEDTVGYDCNNDSDNNGVGKTIPATKFHKHDNSVAYLCVCLFVCPFVYFSVCLSSTDCRLDVVGELEYLSNLSACPAIWPGSRVQARLREVHGA